MYIIELSWWNPPSWFTANILDRIIALVLQQSRSAWNRTVDTNGTGCADSAVRVLSFFFSFILILYVYLRSLIHDETITQSLLTENTQLARSFLCVGWASLDPPTTSLFLRYVASQPAQSRYLPWTPSQYYVPRRALVRHTPSSLRVHCVNRVQRGTRFYN